jgi:hypothetical protein
MKKTDVLWASGLIVAAIGWLVVRASPVEKGVGKAALVLGGLLVVLGVLARFGNGQGAKRTGAQSEDWQRAVPKRVRDRDRVAMLSGDDTFSIEVTGESHYQAALERAAGGRTEDGVEERVQAQLVFEPSNPYDSNAVAVFVGPEKVGYLSREFNADFRRSIERHQLDLALPLVCKAVIVGGWSRDGGEDQGSFGIRLDIASEE